MRSSPVVSGSDASNFVIPMYAPSIAWRRKLVTCSPFIQTSASIEGGKPVVTYPIPGVEGAIAKATLNAESQAERIQATVGNVVTEFIYEKYEDYNPADDKVYGYFPGHIVEKRNGTTVLDLTTTQTDVGNLYVVIPVPPNVRAAK